MKQNPKKDKVAFFTLLLTGLVLSMFNLPQMSGASSMGGNSFQRPFGELWKSESIRGCCGINFILLRKEEADGERKISSLQMAFMLYPAIVATALFSGFPASQPGMPKLIYGCPPFS